MLFSALQEESEGALRTDDERFYDLLQRLRCAFASNRSKMYIPFTINKNEDFNNLSVEGLEFVRVRIEWKVKPTEFINIPNVLPVPTNDHFLDVNLKALKYDLGTISIIIPESKKTVFEQFVKNADFSKEYSKVSGLIKANELTKAIECLLNYSYCVYEKLSIIERKLVFKSLAEKFILSEEYEDMVLNLIRSSIKAADSKDVQKEIVGYLLHKRISPTAGSILLERDPNTIFECFENGINNVGGKDNYDEFILEMAKLYNSAYSAELRAAEGGSCCLYFNWSRQGTETLYSYDGVIDIRKLAFHGYYNYCDRINPNYISPGGIVLVNYTRDFSFIGDKDKRLVAMPAFALKYVIDQQVKELKLNFVNNIMAAFTKAVSALSLISNASKLEKLKIGWDVLKSTIGLALLNKNVEAEIKKLNKGDKFLNCWEYFQNLDALSSGVSGITKVFNNETFGMFTELSSAWDILSKDPNIDKYLNRDKVTNEINNLKTIFNDEGIVY